MLACPVAFGETSVVSRIKNILSYKKPGTWIIAISLLSCIMIAMFFVTSPQSSANENGNPAPEPKPQESVTEPTEPPTEAPTEHIHTCEWQTVKEASCFEPGEMKNVCTQCGAVTQTKETETCAHTPQVIKPKKRPVRKTDLRRAPNARYAV